MGSGKKAGNSREQQKAVANHINIRFLLRKDQFGGLWCTFLLRIRGGSQKIFFVALGRINMGFKRVWKRAFLEIFEKSVDGGLKILKIRFRCHALRRAAIKMQSQALCSSLKI